MTDLRWTRIAINSKPVHTECAFTHFETVPFHISCASHFVQRSKVAVCNCLRETFITLCVFVHYCTLSCLSTLIPPEACALLRTNIKSGEKKKMTERITMLFHCLAYFKLVFWLCCNVLQVLRWHLSIPFAKYERRAPVSVHHAPARAHCTLHGVCVCKVFAQLCVFTVHILRAIIIIYYAIAFAYVR